MSSADLVRCHQLAAGFEHLQVQVDLNGGAFHWATPAPHWGRKHRIDLDAEAALQGELERLKAFWLAGGNRD